MKQEKTKYNIYKIRNKKKDVKSILDQYKKEIDDMRSEIDKSIEYLDKLMKENNSN